MGSASLCYRPLAMIRQTLELILPTHVGTGRTALFPEDGDHVPDTLGQSGGNEHFEEREDGVVRMRRHSSAGSEMEGDCSDAEQGDFGLDGEEQREDTIRRDGREAERTTREEPRDPPRPQQAGDDQSGERGEILNRWAGLELDLPEDDIQYVDPETSYYLQHLAQHAKINEWEGMECDEPTLGRATNVMASYLSRLTTGVADNDLPPSSSSTAGDPTDPKHGQDHPGESAPRKSPWSLLPAWLAFANDCIKGVDSSEIKALIEAATSESDLHSKYTRLQWNLPSSQRWKTHVLLNAAKKFDQGPPQWPKTNEERKKRQNSGHGHRKPKNGWKKCQNLLRVEKLEPADEDWMAEDRFQVYVGGGFRSSLDVIMSCLCL